MIIHGRCYLDVIPNVLIDLDCSQSEINTHFKKSYGGIANILTFLQNTDVSLIFYGSKKSLSDLTNIFKIKIKFFINCGDVEVIILKPINSLSRLSLINKPQKRYETHTTNIISPQDLESQVIFYLESIPYKIQKLKSRVITIFNGGQELIPKDIFDHNIYLTDILISSNESFQNLDVMYQKKLKDSNKTFIIHNPESVLIQKNGKTTLVQNEYYDTQLNQWAIGAGDYFSLKISQILDADRESVSIPYLVECVKSACKESAQFLREKTKDN